MTGLKGVDIDTDEGSSGWQAAVGGKVGGGGLTIVVIVLEGCCGLLGGAGAREVSEGAIVRKGAGLVDIFIKNCLDINELTGLKREFDLCEDCQEGLCWRGRRFFCGTFRNHFPIFGGRPASNQNLGGRSRQNRKSWGNWIALPHTLGDPNPLPLWAWKPGITSALVLHS